MRQWFEFQKKLYEQTQRELKESLKSQPKELKRYESIFRRDNAGLKRSSRKNLTTALNNSQTVFFGDFHSLRQSQRLLLRLLQDSQIKKPQSIAFEAIKASDEERIRKFQKNSTPKLERDLRIRLQLEDRFGSAFSVYRELFLLMGRLKIQVKGLALESTNLQARDRFAAKELAHMKSRTWVLFGEFHCARPLLPSQLRLLRPDAKITVIQQNDDALSIRHLKELGSEKTLIFQAQKKHGVDLFSILHTPLWVKWQSVVESLIRRQESGVPLDPHEQTLWSVKTLSSFLADPRYHSKRTQEWLDLEVVEAADEGFSDAISSLSGAEQNRVVRELEHSRSSLSKDGRRLFLSECTINSCAHAAALFLFHRWSATSIHLKDFYPLALREALVFLMSKILNHSRKSRGPEDWKSEASALSQRVLRAFEFPTELLNRKNFQKDLRPYLYESAIALGRFLGDHAFEAFLVGEFSKERLIRLVTEPAETNEVALPRLMELKSLSDSFIRTTKRRW